jgi:hypothetical protein
MNHLESSFTGKNAFWRYLLMLAAVLVVTNTIGAIPLIISIAIKTISDPTIITKLSADPNDLSPLGLGMNIDLLFMLFPYFIEQIHSDGKGSLFPESSGLLYRLFIYSFI